MNGTVTSLFLLSFLTFGCTESETNSPNKTLTVTTWNVALSPNYVAYAVERQPAVLDALQTVDSDIICLQEVWFEPARDAVRAVLESNGYNVHIYLTEGGDASGGCTVEESDPLKNCVYDFECDKVDPESLVSCVTDNCGEELGQVSSECSGCMAQNLSLPVDEIMEQCIGVVGAIAFSHEGHNGLVLASKSPLSNIEEADFDASLNYRSYIKATIAEHDVQVVCTHLTADQSIPYTGKYSGYPEEQAQQVDQLLGVIASNPRLILIGDINTGPSNEAAGISAEIPENWQKFTDAGWSSHTASECTWCPDANSLINSGTDLTIDHVMTHTSWADGLTGTSTRLFEETVTIQDADGVDQVVNISDHFGMTTTLRWSAD